MSDGILIRSARQFADLRVRGLAKLAGLSPASVSLAETGELKFSNRTRRRVLEILLQELSRTHGIPRPHCVSEYEIKRELGRLIAAAEVLRAERALLSATALLASWG